jgi:hypothetical protein
MAGATWRLRKLGKLTPGLILDSDATKSENISGFVF